LYHLRGYIPPGNHRYSIFVFAGYSRALETFFQ
jgi:hypothetical protein